MHVFGVSAGVSVHEQMFLIKRIVGRVTLSIMNSSSVSEKAAVEEPWETCHLCCRGKTQC